MIKSLKLYNSCVASMRKAQKAYQENPTPFNRGIMLDLQNKVDAWIDWINKQHDAELAKSIPPFLIQQNLEGSRRELNNDMLQRLRKVHSQEEIDNFLKSLSQR